MRVFTIAAAVAILGCAWASPGNADVMTFANTTTVQAYNGNSPDNFFGGQSWGANVGDSDGFDTTGIVINRQTNSIDFQIQTAFDGPDTSYANAPYNVTISYADIFLNPIDSATPPTTYQYAISLGDQTANGGLAVGFYQVTSDKTSEQIWSSRTQFIYGGKYAPDGDTAAAQYAPTVVTGGTLLTDWTVTILPYSDGVLDVSLSTTDAAQFAALFDNFDLFWGTGDCSNAPLFVAVDAAAVPEPPALAMLAAGLVACGFYRRKRASGRA
jgi:hypothetical protein